MERSPGAGLFGDSFGAVNALFSGLAFAGVIYAIILQRKELQLQREELEATRGELKGQKEALRAQASTLQIQQFENTFFQLLRLQNEIREAMTFKERVHGAEPFTAQQKVLREGIYCFEKYYYALKSSYRVAPENESEIEKLDHAYNEFFKRYQSQLGHYFRNLYNIVKIVHKSTMKDKTSYTNILRAQLSTYEHILLFYNCLSRRGVEKFKPFINDYALLNNMDTDLLLNEDHQHLYDKEAYGKIH